MSKRSQLEKDLEFYERKCKESEGVDVHTFKIASDYKERTQTEIEILDARAELFMILKEVFGGDERDWLKYITDRFVIIKENE